MLDQQVAKQTKSNEIEGLVINMALMMISIWCYLLAENKRLRKRIAELEAALKLERAKRFGSSSERSDTSKAGSESKEEDKVPLIIEGEAIEISPNLSEAPAAQSQWKRQRGGQLGHKGHGRSIPADLPREDVFCELPEGERSCGNCGLVYKDKNWTEDAEEVVVSNSKFGISRLHFLTKSG